jgi:sugar/nucleoside kinase (ribokinase family)
MKNALFVGLTTLDLIYRSPSPPQSNQKLVATDYALAAGGPATNAAIAFRHLGNSTLGNSATLLSVIGAHPLTQLIHADLAACGVHSVDLDPQRAEPSPMSSIIVTEATGERSVISINAVRSQATPEQLPPNCLQDMDLLLVDGHQMAIAQALATTAKEQGIPVVLDGGSWKPGCEALLPWVDYAVCSANFHPPGCISVEETLAYLAKVGVPYRAVTQGEQEIVYADRTQTGHIPVPQIQAIDTLGAGDIFHGAFCHFILHHSFTEALAQASAIAAHSCKFFGTRQWMEENGSLGDG